MARDVLGEESIERIPPGSFESTAPRGVGVPPALIPPLVPVEAVTAWANLKDRLRDQRGWIYRGQGSAAWRLQTTLERSVHAEHRSIAEQNLLFQYKQAIFASMQHHGAPTRLLDFTRSPYVATYFAVEDVSEESSCVVWAIDEAWCGRRAEVLLKAGGVLDGKRCRDDAYVFCWLYLHDDEWPVCRAAAPAGVMRMSQRQIAQQALFLVPGDLSCSLEDNLRSTAESDADLREHVKCYQIPASQKAEILRDLRLMNISRASLFPGLDGFAQSLKYSLIEEDPSQWNLRAALRELRDLPI
jgi:hypothetical protein